MGLEDRCGNGGLWQVEGFVDLMEDLASDDIINLLLNSYQLP